LFYSETEGGDYLLLVFLQGALMSIAYKEGIKIAPPAMQEIILSSNQDIRQVCLLILLLCQNQMKSNQIILYYLKIEKLNNVVRIWLDSPVCLKQSPRGPKSSGLTRQMAVWGIMF
jgi:hypothetical protein